MTNGKTRSIYDAPISQHALPDIQSRGHCRSLTERGDVPMLLSDRRADRDDRRLTTGDRRVGVSCCVRRFARNGCNMRHTVYYINMNIYSWLFPHICTYYTRET